MMSLVIVSGPATSCFRLVILPWLAVFPVRVLCAEHLNFKLVEDRVSFPIRPPLAS